jgi:hypothetical protein
MQHEPDENDTWIEMNVEIKDLGVRMRKIVFLSFVFFGLFSINNIFSQNLDSGLVAYYPFNGNANDGSGNGNDGKIIGNGKFSLGVKDRSLYFNGDGDYVDLGNGFNFDYDYSISLWILADDLKRSDAGLFAKYESNHYGPYDLYLNYNKVAFWVSNGYGGYTQFSSNISVPQKCWTHILLSVKDNSAKIYINGVFDIESPVPKITQNTDKVTIGRQALFYDTYSLQFEGKMDEIRVYNRALEENEINILYEEGKEPTIEIEPKDLDYGILYDQIDSVVALKLINNSTKKLIFDKVIFSNNLYFKISNNLDTLIVNPNSTLEVPIIFAPNSVGTFYDTLNISSYNECGHNYYINLKGSRSFKCKTIISLPDTIINIGSQNTKIPMNTIFSAGCYYSSNLSFITKIKFNASTFLPTSVTKGKILDDSIDKDFYRIITIQCDTANISDSDSILTEITGTVLLGDTLTKLEILDFKWYDSNIEIDTIIDGSLQTKACALQLRRVQLFTPFDFSIRPNPASDNILISYANSELSNPSISIINSLGIELKRVGEKDLSGQSSIRFSIEGFPTGIYYCIFNSGSDKITKSFIVVR